MWQLQIFLILSDFTSNVPALLVSDKLVWLFINGYQLSSNSEDIHWQANDGTMFQYVKGASQKLLDWGIIIHWCLT